MSKKILGISAFYHDSAAAIVVDGEIIAAAHEERFTRKKHDASFPINAIKYVIEESGSSSSDINVVAFYDKPFIKFERLVETYHAFAPLGLRSFLSSMPVWIKEKLFMKKLIKDKLKKINISNFNLFFPEHHLSHAASAYYPSPFQDAAILTLDGVGEWATTTISKGMGNKIKLLKELNFPHSLGLLYSSFTYFLGFKVNSGEYKLMGLAPYGIPNSKEVNAFKNKIYDSLIDLKEDGSFLMNMKYFNYTTGLKMCNNKLWFKLFSFERRKPDDELKQCHMNLALAIQEVTEEIVLKIAKTAKGLTKSKNIVLAGGVALNSVANGKLLKAKIFDNIWIQPASGDAGGALGAALATFYIEQNNRRLPLNNNFDQMKGSYLGPEFSQIDIKRVVLKYSAKFNFFNDFNELSKTVAKILSDEYVVGWFQGRMEYGPRSLGNRSILGDARSPNMQKKMNLKIKYREGFRPFAPSVLEEDVSNYFSIDVKSPYMLLVVPIIEKIKTEVPVNYNELGLYDRLYHLRSIIPAITHVDFSARIQSVSKSTNPRYWHLINEFKKITKSSVIINTSFNVRGEPIVCNPDDAFRCFMRTEMDYLVIGNYLFNKKNQTSLLNDSDWKEEFVLD